MDREQAVMAKSPHWPHWPRRSQPPQPASGKLDWDDIDSFDDTAKAHDSTGGKAFIEDDDPSDPRPPPPSRSDTVHSRYVEMLLGQDDIPKFHNIMASFFVWMLLAGFLVFPGTFTKLQKMDTDAAVEAAGGGGDADGSDKQRWDSDAVETLLRGAKNVPLVVIGAVACGLSAAGMALLALRHCRNFVWLLNRLFLPGATNSAAGLISTLVGIYTQQDGAWSVMARVTAIVEGGCLLVCGGLFVFVERFLLRKVKETHGEFYGEGGSAQGPPPDEGFVEKMERKRREPGLEPGSVV